MDQHETENTESTAEKTTIAQAATPPSSDLTKDVEAVMGQIIQLGDLYRTETEALHRADSEAFTSLQEQKERDVVDYEIGMQKLMRRPENLKHLDPALKAKLKELQEEFSTLVRDNATALTRMQGATKRLNNLIMNATRRAVQNDMAVNYGASGRLKTEEGKRLSTGRVSRSA